MVLKFGSSVCFYPYDVNFREIDHFKVISKFINLNFSRRNTRPISKRTTDLESVYPYVECPGIRNPDRFSKTPSGLEKRFKYRKGRGN